MTPIKILVPITATAILLAACGSTLEQKAATGGLGGAAVGAVVDGGRGALIGGAAGAVGGAVVHEATKK